MKLQLFAGIVVAVGLCATGVAASAPLAPLSCNGTYNSQTLGAVTVPAGAVCHLDSDTVNGSITVSGQLYASSLTVTGGLSSQGGKVVQIDSSSISGAVSLAHLGNGPSDQDSVSVVINSIGGNLFVQGSSSPTGDLLVSSNTVNGNEAEAFNTVTGDLAITAESVSGSMAVFKNTGAGTKEVDGNSVGNFMVCLGNQAPFEAHDNSARVFLGNC